MTNRKRKLYERYFARKLNEYLTYNPTDNPGNVQTRISAATSIYLAGLRDDQPAVLALENALEILFIDLHGDTDIL